VHPKELSIKDFDYNLPESKIAFFPLEKRDQSKLLIYENGTIRQDVYRNLFSYLPENTLLVFNDTRVINARIRFTKPTGGVIEIFCLEPYETIMDYGLVLKKGNSVRWKCMIGGAGKWKQHFLEKRFRVNGREVSLRAQLVEKLKDAYVAEFRWEPGDLSFAEILEHAGKIPLPPYIRREAEKSDTERYQTIYSRLEGSVAAPTAGLHFTQAVFGSLKEKGIDTAFVTLHVGAGTFKPVKSDTMKDHEMHAEYIDVSPEVITILASHIEKGICCVGTTSVRTVESLYWMGLKAWKDPSISTRDLEISQWEVYEGDLQDEKVSPKEALTALGDYMASRQMARLFTRTQIIIAPGYTFKLVGGMFTNFHQPKSTLLLLVAAMTGGQWRAIYEHALGHDFRFLSYGDGCLIFYDPQGK
jgi:S-adenosylmethionine:tRNA ribosyltransferase-isomerase